MRDRRTAYSLVRAGRVGTYPRIGRYQNGKSSEPSVVSAALWLPEFGS